MLFCLATVDAHLLVTVETVLGVRRVALKLNAAPEARSDGCLAAPWLLFFEDFKGKLNDSLSESVQDDAVCKVVVDHSRSSSPLKSS